MQPIVRRRFIAAILALSAMIVPGAEAQHPNLTVNHQVPRDVEIPAGHMGNPIAFFDDLSWRSFVALSWPADPAQRGAPDIGKQLGDDAENVVWETWKSDAEVFQPGGRAPAPWSSFATATPVKALAAQFAGSAKVLGTSTPVGTSIAHFNQAGAGTQVGTLIAQNQTYTRYEVRINQAEFDFIRNNEYYLASRLPGVNDPPIIFPNGSIEIKAAWHEFKLPEEQPLLSRYYTREAVLVDHQEQNARTATMGLVGLHIVHRTPSRPEWVWTTFEHIDNLEAPTGITPTFRDPAGAGPENKLESVVDRNNPPKANPTRTQVRRVKAIHDSTAETNNKYRTHPQISGTVWSNYQLVTTQWPTNPAQNDTEFAARSVTAYPAGAGVPFPGDAPGTGTAISNVTMETPTGTQLQFSCMKCHFARVNHNTEFVWFLRMRAFERNPVLVEEKRARLLKFSTDTMESVR